MRIGVILLFVALLWSAASGAPFAEQSASGPDGSFPPLEVTTCVGGPAPLFEGKIAGAGAEEGSDRFYILTRYPERLYVFTPSSLTAEAAIDTRVEQPLVVVPAVGLFLCAVPVENEDGFFTLSAYSLSDGKLVRQSPKMSGELLQLLYSPALARFIGAAATGEIISWGPDLADYKVLRKYEDIFSISLDASGRQIAVFSPNRFTDVLDASDGKILLHDESNSFKKVLLIDGEGLAVANTFGKGVKLVRLGKGEESFDFGGGAKVSDIALSPDGKALYISFIGGKIQRWNLKGNVPELEREIESVFSGGSTLLPLQDYLITLEDYFFEVWKAADLSPVYSSEKPKLFDTFAVSPSGAQMVGVYQDKIYHYRLDGSRLVPLGSKLILDTSLLDVRAMRFYSEDKIWVVGAVKCGWLNPADFSFEQKLDFKSPILSPRPRFCCGGDYFLVFRKNSEVAVFKVSTAEEVLSFLPTTFLDEAGVSPDLSLVATRAVPLEIFRVSNRECLFSMRKGLHDLKFSPDGRFLYGYNADGIVTVDVKARKALRTTPVPGTIDRLITGRSKALAFSNKGIFLVDLAAGKVSAAHPAEGTDVRNADYRNGLCMFQSADSHICIIRVNLDD